MQLSNEKLKKIPLKPGIYKFLGKSGVILYVGRATSLRRRVSQYFQKELNPRIAEMVSLASDIKFQKTDTLLEAIILEANLIKKFWPKYNVKDRDDRSFVYILISKKDDFPKPIIIRGHELGYWKSGIKNFKVFGPYQSLTVVKNALNIIRRIFPYSTCSPAARRITRNERGITQKTEREGKPCFEYQIGLCPGVCIGAISKEDYRKNVNDIILLLSGEKSRLLKKLQKENPKKISFLKHIQDVSLITSDQQLAIGNQTPIRIEGYDISHFAGKETYGSMVVLINGRPDKAQYRLFKIKGAPANDDLRALAEIVSRRFDHPEWPFPDIIMIDGGKPQVDYISKLLQNIKFPHGSASVSYSSVIRNIPIVGISKFGGDIPVFPFKTKNTTKELIQSIKPALIMVRDEAHRFALKSSRRKRNKQFKI